MLKKFLGAAAVACSIGFMAGPANAAFVLENIQLNFNGIDGLDDTASPGSYTYSEVDALTFLATVHAVTDDTNGNFLPDAGETGQVNGFGLITGFSNNGGIAPSDSGANLLNSGTIPTVPPLHGFELTFQFVDVPIEYVDNDGTFVHTGPSAGSVGILNMWIDNLSDGSTCQSAMGTAAANCTDGVLIASYVITPGDGGAFTFHTFDGSDDATFASTFLLAGVWFDEFGNDLGCDNADIDEANHCTKILGLADSNFDADPQNTGGFNFDPASFDCGNTPVDFCASEDGSFVIARIPEPTTLGLLGIGLAGLGFLSVRRRKQD
ncbi:MAG: PEP-CTERM sorting domain-containing protein [Kiloniellaceae bacterium]